MSNDLNVLNKVGMTNGFSLTDLEGQATIEERIAAMSNKMKEGIGMMSTTNGDIVVSTGKDPIVVGVNGIPAMPSVNGFGAVPEMPHVTGTAYKMDAETYAAGLSAGVFGKKSYKEIDAEELRNARWYQKHIVDTWIPGSTKENPLTANLSMVTDNQSNADLHLYAVVINDEVVPAITLMPAEFKWHLEAGFKVVLRVMHTLKGARYYGISYKLDEETGELYSVLIHGLTHPVKNPDGSNKLGADNKPVFEYNDGITIQVSAQFHSAAHKLVAAFIEWAKAVGYDY